MLPGPKTFQYGIFLNELLTPEEHQEYCPGQYTFNVSGVFSTFGISEKSLWQLIKYSVPQEGWFSNLKILVRT